MRHLGIDYGTKKVGLALSDPSGSMAFPHSVVPNDEQMVSYLEDLITKEGVQQVVIGHSLNKDGAENTLQEHITELIGDLTLAVGIPIALENEQFTTQAALRIQGRNTQTDASAAALILDAFLQKNR